MMQDFILFSDISVIISSSCLHRLPSPSSSLQMSVKYWKWIQARSELINNFILWQYNSLLTLKPTLNPFFFSLSREICHDGKISKCRIVLYLNNGGCYFTLTSFCDPFFFLYLTCFFLLSSGKKKAKIWAVFASYKHYVTIRMNSP